MSKLKKIIEDAKKNQTGEVDISDRGIHSFNDIPALCMYIKPWPGRTILF